MRNMDSMTPPETRQDSSRAPRGTPSPPIPTGNLATVPPQNTDNAHTSPRRQPSNADDNRNPHRASKPLSSPRKGRSTNLPRDARRTTLQGDPRAPHGDQRPAGEWRLRTHVRHVTGSLTETSNDPDEDTPSFRHQPRRQP